MLAGTAALLYSVSKLSQDRKCPGRNFRGHYCSWSTRWPRRKWQGARQVRAKASRIKNDPGKKLEDKFCPLGLLVLRLPRQDTLSPGSFLLVVRIS